MADNDNKELKELLEKQFENFEKRFDSLERGLKKEIAAATDGLRAEIAAAKEETMRHTGVLIENVRHDLAIIGEGVMAINEKMGREKEENEREHARLDRLALINTADISKLDQRVGKLEGKA